MKEPKQFEFCECDGPTCCGGRGPAVWSVIRDGVKLKVCTRCDLSSDKDRTLIIDNSYPADVLMRFDPLGAFVITDELASVGDHNGKS